MWSYGGVGEKEESTYPGFTSEGLAHQSEPASVPVIGSLPCWVAVQGITIVHTTLLEFSWAHRFCYPCFEFQKFFSATAGRSSDIQEVG